MSVCGILTAETCGKLRKCIIIIKGGSLPYHPQQTTPPRRGPGAPGPGSRQTGIRARRVSGN